MNSLLFIEQGLNGLQFGVTLFLLAAGLTLILGVMNFMNLAHGVLFMLGAYYCASLAEWTGSFWTALPLALLASAFSGILLEFFVIRHLYNTSHLNQVLATFGLIFFFNEFVIVIWGPAALFMDLPEGLNGRIEIVEGLPYPAFRLAIILAGLIVAAGLYYLISHTRAGMLIRAGSFDREMLSALGINSSYLFNAMFGLGAMLAGFAGLLTGPIQVIESGMGDPVLILALVVIVIGGIGSIRGAFIAALAVGLIDTWGRVFLPKLLTQIIDTEAASTAGPALSSMLIYVLMAAILVARPQGLFPARTG